MAKSGHIMVRTKAQIFLRRFSNSRRSLTLIAAASGAALGPFAEFGCQKKRTYYGAHPCPEKGLEIQQFWEYVRSFGVRGEKSNDGLLKNMNRPRFQSDNFVQSPPLDISEGAHPVTHERSPRQQNLWVDFGSGKAPSARYRATSTALNVRNLYDFLVVSFRRLLNPSMTPLETVFLAELS
jgi:hypothetical protein